MFEAAIKALAKMGPSAVSALTKALAGTSDVQEVAVNALGHCHPAIVETITRQAQQLIHSSDLYYTEPKVFLAKKLVELAFPSRVFLNNSGAEANDTAIKIARKWGKKHKDGAFEIISAFGAFHGRTLASVTMGGKAAYSKWFEPLPPGFIHVPYNDLDAIKAVTNDRSVAICLEPVIGEGGVIPAAPGYLEGVRKWCDEKDILLMLDEVQTGFGRTGRWFAHQHAGITPDVMTLAKALGGGFPIAAVLAVPKADVIVTNPTELAIAIQYDPETMAAPIVVVWQQWWDRRTNSGKVIALDKAPAAARSGARAKVR